MKELIKINKFGGRGKKPETSSPHDEKNFSTRRMNLPNNIDCGLCLSIKISLPLTMDLKCAFTPILPYPATEYDAIFTTMINFQDVLKQKEHENRPLWSDEGVHHSAKEIQL